MDKVYLVGVFVFRLAWSLLCCWASQLVLISQWCHHKGAFYILMTSERADWNLSRNLHLYLTSGNQIWLFNLVHRLKLVFTCLGSRISFKSIRQKCLVVVKFFWLLYFWCFDKELWDFSHLARLLLRLLLLGNSITYLRWLVQKLFDLTCALVLLIPKRTAKASRRCFPGITVHHLNI